MNQWPKIIQGGMGIAVSNWKLARTVAQENQLGVVSGTGIDTVMVRRLQDGDQEGHVRRALYHFPDQEVTKRILKDFYIEGGKTALTSYKRLPFQSIQLSIPHQQILVLASFVEVFLAKENHSGCIGINLLEKIQIPNLALLYGALLAGVDYVIMGAGIPREIPGALDQLVEHKEASLKLNVQKSSQEFQIKFSPKEVFPTFTPISLKRPYFLAIVSSDTLANHLIKKSTGEVNGFIVEGHKAGGHNAPPRGPLLLDETGAPLYSEKDQVDLKAIAKLEKPFWLAGTYASPEKLKEALDSGATGIQVGTAFAFCDESGQAQNLKQEVIANHKKIKIFTDPYASPTGFPFKVTLIKKTISENICYEQRTRICDLGYLRELEQDDKGKLIYRCPAEPKEEYLKKGGKEENLKNRKCLCNSLFAVIGQAQIQKDNYIEPALITAGDDLIHLHNIIPQGQNHYSVKDVISYLLANK